MLKNIALIGVGALLALVVLGVAGYAFAQSQFPPVPDSPYGPGMMGGRGGMMGGRGGMMGGWRGEGTQSYGPMHEYMEKAMAEALGITEEQLEEQLAEGKTMWQVAEEKGYTWEQFSDLMGTARAEAFKQMVADGVLTQDQADWMLSRMNSMMRGGGCPGMGGGFGPRYQPVPQTTEPVG